MAQQLEFMDVQRIASQSHLAIFDAFSTSSNGRRALGKDMNSRMKAPTSRRSPEPFAFVPACNATIGRLLMPRLNCDLLVSIGQKSCLLIYSETIFQETATIQGLDCKSDAE